MTRFRIVVGCGEAQGYDLLALAARIADAAQGLGMTLVSVKSSHAVGSSSRYITLRDSYQRPWLIRVSNHDRPRSSPHETPHLDLISLDGNSGLPEATDFLRRIMAGDIAWNNCWSETSSRKVRKIARRTSR